MHADTVLSAHELVAIRRIVGGFGDGGRADELSRASLLAAGEV
jgi:hypothetical protein